MGVAAPHNRTTPWLTTTAPPRRYYTWSPYNVGSADKVGLEYVPMLWGPKQEGEWWSQVASWPSTVKHVLFFNE